MVLTIYRRKRQHCAPQKKKKKKIADVRILGKFRANFGQNSGKLGQIRANSGEFDLILKYRTDFGCGEKKCTSLRQ